MCHNFLPNPNIVCPVVQKKVTLTFDVSNDDHDEEAVMVGMVGVVNTSGDLTSAYNFLHCNQHQLDGQEGHTFIEEVQWAVKDEVPEFVRTEREVDNKMLE